MNPVEKWCSMVNGNIDEICKQFINAIEYLGGERKMDINNYCELVKSIKDHYLYDSGVLRININNFGKVFGFNGLSLTIKEFNELTRVARDYGVFITRYKNSIIVCEIQRILNFFNIFESDDPMVDIIYYRIDDVKFKDGFDPTRKYDDEEEDDDDNSEEVENCGYDDDHLSPDEMVKRVEALSLRENR